MSRVYGVLCDRDEYAMKLKKIQCVLRMSCLVATAVLVSCAAKPVRPPPVTPPASLPSVRTDDLREATQYAVNAGATNVQIHVFRGGTLSRLGHNHVMTAQQVTGRVWTHTSIEKSGFELAFPVAELIVDDPQARAAAGAEFPGEISQGDRDGTRKNMLRTEVLDAEHHPTITLRSTRVAGSMTNSQVTARITIKGVSQDVAVPLTVAVNGERLTARGKFDIQQTAFGIKPFSVALGALEVLDRLHVEFAIVADKASSK